MTTELPRDLVKRVIDRLMEHYDCGPPGEGWQSELLLADINAMEAALAAPTVKGGTEVRDEDGFTCEYDGSLPDDDFTVTWGKGARWVMLQRSGKITIGQSPSSSRPCKTTSWEELFSPPPPSGVETIRQDSEGATDA